MRIKVTDITKEGRDLGFDIDQESLNVRIDAAQNNTPENSVAQQEYRFTGDARSDLHLTLEGSTVVIRGKASGSYASPCARCVEECTTALHTEVNMLLKPRQPGAALGADDEDLQFGFYDGGEVDCGSIVEECIILALPQTVVCSESCKGLCAKCGANLNAGACGCPEPEKGDERFAVLKGLKAVQ